MSFFQGIGAAGSNSGYFKSARQVLKQFTNPPMHYCYITDLLRPGNHRLECTGRQTLRIWLITAEETSLARYGNSLKTPFSDHQLVCIVRHNYES